MNATRAMNAPHPIATSTTATEELLQELHHHRDRRIRDELVRRHIPLVRSLCRRYLDRGVELDDLVQVGVIGLLKALDRYDPERGVAFASFAVPTVLGEIRRHFRDHGWSVKVPRGLQELRQRADRAREELAQRLGRQPTAREIASRLGVAVDEVLLALDGIRSCFRPDTLDGVPVDTAIDDLDVGEQVVLAELVRDALRCLPERQQEIIRLRYGLGLTQQEIAERIGISQMHVSRLLRSSHDRLRAVLVLDEVSPSRDQGIPLPDRTGGNDELATASRTGPRGLGTRRRA